MIHRQVQNLTHNGKSTLFSVQQGGTRIKKIKSLKGTASAKEQTSDHVKITMHYLPDLTLKKKII